MGAMAGMSQFVDRERELDHLTDCYESESAEVLNTDRRSPYCDRLATAAIRSVGT